MDNDTHQAVLLEQAVDALAVKSDGAYLDATFGRGGHSAEIMRRLGVQGRLFGVDKDPQAIDAAKRQFADDERFSIWRGSFSQLGQSLTEQNWDQGLQGVLMDLGVSSPQLDQAERGFSFRFDGPLDMRMDSQSGQTAAQWLAAAEQREIEQVIWEYGEERFARRIAGKIVEYRQGQAIERTSELADLVAAAVPTREPGKHPATRTFQALRMVVNAELQDLELGLQAAVEALVPGGRLVVISFHSLEDRMVKRFIRDESTQASGNRRLPPNPNQQKLRLHRCGKAIRPGRDEQKRNPRARSAIMRIAERLAA